MLLFFQIQFWIVKKGILMNIFSFYQIRWTLWKVKKKIRRTIIIEFKERSKKKQPPEVFCEKSVLRNFTKFTGKHLCKGLFFNQVACLRPATLLKKRLWHRCFPVNFAAFLRTPFFTEHLRMTASAFMTTLKMFFWHHG